MSPEERISSFSALGSQLADFLANYEQPATPFEERLKSGIQVACQRNSWFTPENCTMAIAALVSNLEEASLKQWVSRYDQRSFQTEPKQVGLIMAGNIPLVGFHDMLAVLISGHAAEIKLSSDDNVLLPIICEQLSLIDQDLGSRIKYTERLNEVDAVIATGSDNSSRYFEYYFRNIPHVIRKNRTSIAVLTGNETQDELKELGKDIFNYFGLGCRNVSQLLLPQGFDINRIYEAVIGYANVINNNKYANNHDYYRAVYALNKIILMDNEFLLMKEDVQLHSPVSLLHYWYYRDVDALQAHLLKHKNEIQCIVGRHPEVSGCIGFGKSQQPALWDYADGVDTIAFLLKLS